MRYISVLLIRTDGQMCITFSMTSLCLTLCVSALLQGTCGKNKLIVRLAIDKMDSFMNNAFLINYISI